LAVIILNSKHLASVIQVLWPRLAADNYMGFDTFSALGATISLECAILLLGATLFLDYRRAMRRQWLLGQLHRVLRSEPVPEFLEGAQAA
jgi:hypothetical protein